MQLTVQDVCKMFNVHENTVYRWANNHELPAEMVNNRFHFNRTELLEWAADKKLQISPEFFRIKVDNGGAVVGLDAALRLGGIHRHVPADDAASALHALVDRLPLPPQFDRAALLEVFLSREALGSTAIGDGLAIPHPRFPVVLPVPHAFITLCFLEKPIAFGNGALGPVHTVFAIVSNTVRNHLNLLARLSFALRHEPFRDAIRQKFDTDVILHQADCVESLLRTSEKPLEEVNTKHV